MNKLLERLRARRNELWSRMVDDCPDEVALWNQNRMKASYAKCDRCGLGELTPDIECYGNYCVAYNSDASMFAEVAVDDTDIQKCVEFSEKYDYGKSATRGASDIDKLKSDNVAGKTGEFVVRNTLRSLGVQTGEPDLCIYPPDRKSFDPDLPFIFNGCNNGISVKTFRIHPGKPSRVSWVIQRSERDGRGGKDRHFFDPDPSFRKDQWFAGVALSPDLRHGRILAFLQMQLLYDAGTYGEMETRNGTIENTKRAIYWDDLEQKHLLPAHTGCLQY